MRAPYRSVLRREQKQTTRERILDGAIRVLGTGVAELSMPAVARAARVAVPTVYRHFASKRALLAAIGEHVARKGGAGELPDPDSPEALAAVTGELFRRLDAIEPAARAAMASRLGQKLRRNQLIGPRRKMVAAALAPAAAGRGPADRERLVNVVLILWSSASLQAFKDYLGLSAAEAADHVAWAIRELCRKRS